MHNYKIILEYDGTDFFGWQLQKNKRTVQGELEHALTKLENGKLIRVHGAGRTDTGVHALGQCANFKLNKPWESHGLKRAINGNAGKDIRVHHCEEVPEDFHARYSAIKRRYFYKCRLDESIMDRNYVWQIPSDISMRKLRFCANIIFGENDFTTFSKVSNTVKHTRCIIFQSKWIKRGVFVTYMIESNRFLHHMIRYLVGTMVEVAKGTLTEKEFEVLLQSKNPEAKVYKAPAHGLYLERIFYEI